MRVRVQRQECRITRFDVSAGRLFAQDTDGYGLALGGYGWKQIEAEEHFMALVSAPGYSTNWPIV